MTITQKKIARPSLQAVVGMFILLFMGITLYGYYNYMRYITIARLFLFPLIMVFAVLVLCQKEVFRRWDAKLMIVYTAWVAVVGFLGYRASDYTYERTTYYVAFITLVCYCSAFMKSSRGDGKQAFHILLHGFTALYTAFCLWALVAVIMQTQFTSLTGYNVFLGIDPGYENRLFMFMHPNAVAAMANLVFLLCIYQVMAQKRVAVKMAYVIAAVIVFLTMAMTGSRTNFVAVALCCGLLAFLVICRKLKTKHIAINIGVGLVAAAVVTWGAYQCFEWSVMLVRGMMIPIAAAENVGGTPSVRSLTMDTSFNGRNEIWKIALETIRENPYILLRGVTNEHAVAEVSRYGYIQDSVHNSFLHLLVSAGLPGLLMMLAFLVKLVIACVKLFFTRQEGVPLANQFLPLVALSAMIVAMVESIYFISNRGICNPLFFITAGVIVSQAEKLRKKGASQNESAPAVAESNG